MARAKPWSEGGAVASILAVLLLLLPTLAHAAWEPPADVAEPFNAGVVALGKGDPAAAETAFRQTLATDPACGRCAHGLGIALVRQEKLGDAITVLDRAVTAFPDRAELHTALAGATFARQQFATAIAHAREAVRLDPGSVDAHVALQQGLLREGRTDDARAALVGAALPGPEATCLELLVGIEEGATPPPGKLAYCRQAKHPGLASTVEARMAAGTGRMAAAAALAGDTLSADGQATSVELVASAVRKHQGGDDIGALPLLDRAVTLEPRRVDARILRAVCRARTDDLDGALADLQVVFEADSWVEVHETGGLSGVLTARDEAQLQDGVRKGAGLLVSLLVEAGRLDEAERALGRASAELGMGPRLAAGAARLHAARDERVDAWKVLGPALSQWPDDGDLRLLAAEIAAQDPGVVPPDVAAVLDAAADWRSGYYKALSQARAGEHDACASSALAASKAMGGAVQPAPTPDDQRTVLRLLHTCAVNAERLVDADRAAEAIGSPGALQEVARINHALMRHQAGRSADALQLLEGLTATTPRRQELIDAIRAQASGG
ncbi:MAG: tetratricopeptide repeat protein [Alphaproteobacteria bacterium]|nr:tetratricopeptide repeat protein [Alphaproteobacteria bacterium]